MHLDLALLSIASEGRWIRHLRLPERSSDVRHGRRLASLPECRSRTRTAGHDRAGRESYFRSASLVPKSPASPAWVTGARLLRLERYRPEIRRRAHHFYEHREIQLDLGSGSQSILLASLLLAPA